MPYYFIKTVCKHSSLLLLVLAIPCLSQSQDSQNAIYAEAFGPGLIYSINYERFISKEFTVRGGVSIFSFHGSTSQSTGVIVPIMSNYLLGDENSKCEIGAGIDALSINGKDYGDIEPLNPPRSNSTAGVLLIGSLGYRYQPSAGGLLFRIAATPILSPYTGYFIPTGGCSCGISF